MANLPGIVIKVATDTASAVAGLNKVDKALGRTATASSKFGNAWSAGSKAVALGAAAAGAAVVAFGADSVKAYLDEAKGVAVWDKALDNLGLKSRNKELTEWIDNLQYSANVADSELRPALQSLLTASHDVGASQRALEVALDVSASTGQDLTTVVAALAKGFSGSTGAIGKMNAGLDKSWLKTANMNEILDKLTETMGGANAAKQDTVEGAITGVTNAWGEWQEAFGQGLVGGTGEDAIRNMNELEATLRRSQPLAESLGETISGEAQGFLFGAEQLQTAWTALTSGHKADFESVIGALSAENAQELGIVQDKLSGVTAKADAASSAMSRYAASLEHAAGASAELAAADELGTDPRYMQTAAGEMYRYSHYQTNRANKVAARRKRLQAKKDDRAEALAKARRDEIAKKRAEARSGSKFGAQRTPGRSSC